MSDEPGPTPLEYETPQAYRPPPDDGPARPAVAGGMAFLFGVVAWFGLTILVCGSGSIQLAGGVGAAPPKSRWAGPVLAMFLLAGVAASVFLNNHRDPRRSRREFVLALLLGVGAAVLIHGACFALNVTQ